MSSTMTRTAVELRLGDRLAFGSQDGIAQEPDAVDGHVCLGGLGRFGHLVRGMRLKKCRAQPEGVLITTTLLDKYFNRLAALTALTSTL